MTTLLKSLTKTLPFAAALAVGLWAEDASAWWWEPAPSLSSESASYNQETMRLNVQYNFNKGTKREYEMRYEWRQRWTWRWARRWTYEWRTERRQRYVIVGYRTERYVAYYSRVYRCYSYSYTCRQRRCYQRYVCRGWGWWRYCYWETYCYYYWTTCRSTRCYWESVPVYRYRTVPVYGYQWYDYRYQYWFWQDYQEWYWQSYRYYYRYYYTLGYGDARSTVYIYRGGYASSGYCHNGTLVQSWQTTASSINQTFGGMSWATHAQWAGQPYCVYIRSHDASSWDRWSGTTAPIVASRVTSRTITVDGPQARVDFNVRFDRQSSGYIRIYRAGSTYDNGIGTGCRNYAGTVAPNQGAYMQTNFSGTTSVTTAWSALYRGYAYCIEVRNYRGAGNTRSYAWMTPVVDYARLTGVSLANINTQYPQLQASATADFATPMEFFLYRGGSLSNGVCVNGSLVHQLRHGAASSRGYTYNNTSGWVQIQRNTDYCVNVVTRDGGNRTRGAMVRTPTASTNLTGSINQEAASFTVNGTWNGYAAANSSLALYRNGTCTGTPLNIVSIPWNRTSSQGYTFTPANTAGIVRGEAYCVRMALGNDIRTRNLGTLFNPEIQWLRATVDQVSGRINVTADWTYSSAYTLHLYRGGTAVGGGCNNTAGLQTSGAYPSAGDLNHSFAVARGFHYCIVLRLSTGGDRESIQTEFLLHYPSITSFQGTGNQAGIGIHLGAQFRHTTGWTAEVWRGAASGGNCTGTRVAQTSGAASYLDWRTAPVAQSTGHCVKVRAVNGPLAIQQAANVAALAPTITSAGYTATMANSAAWDDIAALRPSQITGQDDRTVNIGLPFRFMYFGQIFSRLVASTDGWMSMGASNIGVDTQPSVFGVAGDPANLVAPFFANLYCDNLMWKHIQGAPERFIVSWNCRERGNGGHRVEVQAVFVRGRNHVIFRYRDAHFARFLGGGYVKQGMGAANAFVNLNVAGQLLPAAVSRGGEVTMINPRYEEELPRVSGVTATLNHPNASMATYGRSHVPADMMIKVYRGGGGATCAGGAFVALHRSAGRVQEISHTFTNLTRGTTYCVIVSAENTAGIGTAAVTTPELQLIPRILASDVRLQPVNQPATTRYETESLAAVAGEGGMVNGYVIQGGNGGRVATHNFVEGGRYVLRVRAGAMQAGSDVAQIGFYVDGSRVAVQPLYSNGYADMNVLEVVATVPAGNHTFSAQFLNDWCGGCGGSPDGLGRGDRNVAMDYLEVAGPFAASGNAGTVLWSMQPNTTVDVVTQVTLSPGGAIIANDDAGSTTTNGTGTRTVADSDLTAGRVYYARIVATNLAGTATSPWLERRFPYVSGEAVTAIDKVNRTASVAFNTTPASHASVQYRAAGTGRFTGCEGGNWQTMTTGDPVASHTAVISNLNDNTYYCWRVLAEYVRGQPWRTVVRGAPQVFVFDRTAPTVTPPSYKVFEQTDAAGARVASSLLGTPRVDDTVEGISLNATPFYCSRQIAQSCVAWDDQAFRQKGTHYVRWRGVDSANNVGWSAFQRFDIRDTTRPDYAAGPELIVEAQSPAGTIVDLKTLTTGVATNTTFTGTDICDARLDVTQDILVDGVYVPASTYRFPRSTDPGGSGDHTVRVRLRDDSGNMTTGDYTVRVIDTTAPVFTSMPRAIVGLRDGCVTAYLPRPGFQDNSYDNRDLTLTSSHQDGPQEQGGVCWNEGGVMEGEIRVHTVTWTITDPQGNTRSANMRVEVRRPTLVARARVTSGGAELEMGTFARDDVNVQVTLLTRSDGCGEQPRIGEWDWIPVPSQVIQQPDQNLFTGIFTEDGNYIGGYVMVWHCDEFALIPDLTFGIDKVAPTHDYAELLNPSVDANNVDTFLRQFVGNRLDLGGWAASDDRSGVQSVRVTLNPGNPGLPWGTEIGLLEATVAGRGVIITGARSVENLDCAVGSEACVSINERPYLDMALLRTLDNDATLQHRLRIEVRDFAGNVTTTDRYFLLRDYRSSLVDVRARAEALLAGAAGEDYEDDLRSTINHTGEALAYWDARTRELAGPGFRDRQIVWAPSFSRAANASNTLLMGRRNMGPAVLETFANDLGSSMLGEMNMYVEFIDDLRINRESSLNWWANYVGQARSQLAAGAQSTVGSVRAARARDAYNSLAHLYELEYDIYSGVQQNRKIAETHYLGGLDVHQEQSFVGVTVAIQRFLNNILKEQLISARAVSNVGASQLDESIAHMATVTRCTDRLIIQGLNDREFTLCYLNIVEVVGYFREIQSALVDTTAWRAQLAHAVYAMLDASLHYSYNALVSFDGHQDDPMAQTAMAEWQTGLDQLERGEVDQALDRYLANRCRMVRLYNRYWYDAEDPMMGLIDEAPYCQ